MSLLNSIGGARSGSAMSPVMMGLMGLLAYRTLKGKGRLVDMPGTGGSTASSGGLLSGGALAGGLKDLLELFRQSGHEDKAQSWVSAGTNKAIAPHELEQALGEERVKWLIDQTGLPRDRLLAGLSGELPSVVDKLTPEGRIPTDDQLSREG